MNAKIGFWLHQHFLNKVIIFTFSISISLSSLLAEEEKTDHRQTLYLISKNEVVKAVEQYLKQYEKTKTHDFQILEELGHILLEKGAQSGNLEEQLIALFGISLSQEKAPLHLLESGIKSNHPLVQAASLHLLAQRHEDMVNEIIAMALKSDFLMIRFEALHFLIERKAKNALGYVEALANLLDPRARPYFVDFYASFASNEAIHTLKTMISDKNNDVRVAAILAATRFMRDDLLPNIRSSFTDANPGLKEAAAFSLGKLRDLHSLETLRAAKNSPFIETRLATLFSLYQMGDLEAKDAILALAEKGNCYAITLCKEIPEAEPVLAKLLTHEDPTCVLNAALALLSLRCEDALPHLISILFTDRDYEGFIPATSPGRSLLYWKPVSLASLPIPEATKEIQGLTLKLQEEVLRNALDLSEDAFLLLVNRLLQQKRQPHISLITNLLQNRGTPKALKVLEHHAKRNRSSLTRTYCQLALYRIKNTPERKASLVNWLESHKEIRMLSFKPMVQRGARPDQNIANYELSPEETSGLLIEIFDAFAINHDEDTIALLLRAIKDGHEKNRVALSGLLLKSIQ
ncbi:MAG: HEAT repeat domain-containing protein [Verrucomicrobia bacterium]|nr:HEAT repeat domain-containing protein [Verrucomicrobiota bacterium]